MNVLHWIYERFCFEMSDYEQLSIWISGATALGTLTAVVYALFGSLCRHFFQKPNLELNIRNDFPFCYYHKKDNGNESDPVFELLEISAILNNTNEYCARHTRVLCKGIYVPQANGEKFTELLKIRPRQFQWQDISPTRQNSEIDIEQSVDYFVKIAEISKPQNEMTSSDDKKNSNDKPSITISIPDPTDPGSNYIRISYNTVLVEVQVVGSNCRPSTYGIRIDWKGDKIDEYEKKDKLTVKLLNEKQLSSLIP